MALLSVMWRSVVCSRRHRTACGGGNQKEAPGYHYRNEFWTMQNDSLGLLVLTSWILLQHTRPGLLPQPRTASTDNKPWIASADNKPRTASTNNKPRTASTDNKPRTASTDKAMTAATLNKQAQDDKSLGLNSHLRSLTVMGSGAGQVHRHAWGARIARHVENLL